MIAFCRAACHDMDVKIHECHANSWANDGVSAYFYYQVVGNPGRVLPRPPESGDMWPGDEPHDI